MSTPSRRQEFIRGYIVELANSGLLKGRSPATIAATITAAFAEDLRGAGYELAGQAARSALGNLGGAASTILGAWKDLESRFGVK